MKRPGAGQPQEFLAPAVAARPAYVLLDLAIILLFHVVCSSKHPMDTAVRHQFARAEDCALLFLDTSRVGRQCWCSVAPSAPANMVTYRARRHGNARRSGRR